MSAVVLHELTVGASDGNGVRELEIRRRDYEREGTLLVPNGEDWFLAGTIVTVPLIEACANIKTVSIDSQLVRTARDIGISFASPNEAAAGGSGISRRQTMAATLSNSHPDRERPDIRYRKIDELSASPPVRP